MSPVAKSFQQYPMRCKPYVKNNKRYVKILLKNGTQKEVRFYSDIEYEKLYPEDFKITKIRTLKEVLGFANGYITIFKGDTYAELEWFQQSIARYHRLFGWYVVSTENVPDPLPFGITPVKLTADVVFEDDDNLRPDYAIMEVINNLRYDAHPSQFVGKPKDKVELDVIVDKALPIETAYGTATLHIFNEADGVNVFVWNTATCALEPGKKYHLTGTVKEHKTYRNIKQTVLTRCKAKEV